MAGGNGRMHEAECAFRRSPSIARDRCLQKERGARMCKCTPREGVICKVGGISSPPVLPART